MILNCSALCLVSCVFKDLFCFGSLIVHCSCISVSSVIVMVCSPAPCAYSILYFIPSFCFPLFAFDPLWSCSFCVSPFVFYFLINPFILEVQVDCPLLFPARAMSRRNTMLDIRV